MFGHAVQKVEEKATTESSPHHFNTQSAVLKSQLSPFVNTQIVMKKKLTSNELLKSPKNKQATPLPALPKPTVNKKN